MGNNEYNAKEPMLWRMAEGLLVNVLIIAALTVVVLSSIFDWIMGLRER